MSRASALLDHAARQGSRLVARVMMRDHLHLRPERLTHAAARRVRQGLRALEAFLRRLILLLALELEPGLIAHNRPRPRRATKRGQGTRRPGLRIFTDGPGWTGLSPSLSPRSREEDVAAGPLLQRLGALHALLAGPQARARTLAWSLARRRSGWLLAPGLPGDMPRRFGTEISMLYDALAPAIFAASKARPPPLGPLPTCPPRIRLL